MAINFSNDKGSCYLQWQELTALGVNHCFTLKPDDMGIKTAPDQELLKQLYEKARSFAGCHSRKIFFPQQVHGGRVALVDEQAQGIPALAGEYLPDCDGLITNVKGYTLISQYADCTPISLIDPVKKVIAAVHSGWRGTSEKILATALDRMISEYDCNSLDIRVFFWPSIQQDAFEVDEEVAQIFRSRFAEYPDSDYLYQKGCKSHINTNVLNIRQATEKRILKENIHLSGFCTYQDERFHSYRRDKASSGRMALLMELSPDESEFKK